MSYRNRTIVIVLVTLTWVFNFIATFVVEDYRPSESVNAVFAAVIGGAMAMGVRHPDRNGKDEEDDGGE